MPKGTPVAPLEAWAATFKRKAQCHLCGNPERAEVERAYSRGIIKSIITRWLRAKGYVISEASVSRHFREGHHETRS